MSACTLLWRPIAAITLFAMIGAAPVHAQVGKRKRVPAVTPAPRPEAKHRSVAKPAAPARVLVENLGGGVHLELLLIEPGSFDMGSLDGKDDERPVRRVTISNHYYLGRTEITQRQWKQVMGSNPSRFAGDDDRPVEQVSWDEAQSFIERLNKATGGGFRLPTEAEWEYACRAGTLRDYAGELDELAWYDGNAAGATHPVATKGPNAWGLYDMHGNVWEWCDDWYGPYALGAVADPMGPPSGSLRVNRGGGWDFPAAPCRSAARDWDAPETRNSLLGFRVARRVR